MNKSLPALSAIALLLLAGCAHKETATASDDGAVRSDTETAALTNGNGWYYFSDAGIHPAPNPAEIPARAFLPWTEAIRASDTANIGGKPSILINKLGLMTGSSETEASALRCDPLFKSGTAAGIYDTGSLTAIRFYRNSFFADGTDGSDGDGTFLASFDGATGAFGREYASRDFGLDPASQCVALDRVGSMWYASFKNETAGKVDFTYLEFEAFPKKTDSSFDLSGLRKITSESYQKSVAPFTWSEAPESLRTILAGIPETTAFSLKTRSDSALSSQTYVKSGEGVPVDGTAYLSDNLTAVLFADGTFLVRSKSASGAITSIKLPAMAQGYVYTYFTVTATTLIAAWEEQRFFETGRAGILVSTLPDGVY